MCKIDHGGYLSVFVKIRWLKKGSESSWILKGLLARLLREKKKIIHFGSLIKNFKSIIAITKEVQN